MGIAATVVFAVSMGGCSSQEPNADTAGAPDSSDLASNPAPTDGSSLGGSRTDSSATPSLPSSSSSSPSDPNVYPTKTPAPKSQTSVLDSLPSSSGPGCAKVDAKTDDLRSGDVAVGNFGQALTSYDDQVGTMEQPEVHFYVVPKSRKQMKRVSVTLAPTGTTGRRSSVVSTDVEDADVWKYFAVNLFVREPGNYRMDVVSGQDRGCYLITFAKG
ncbi:hypothetical protein ASG90_13095 [Nocardioides sp. Soil797]|nr:hypothetical protein ASG90_13095 [Nocardioides sp. Soil797]